MQTFLQTVGPYRQLVVDGTPTILLAGELHNSSPSSSAYMKPLWDRLRDLNLNAVLAAVSWELVEPKEGTFDFTSVDSLLEGARSHGLKLILLWFGTWKNADSAYVPAWVKADERRFPRAIRRDGRKSSGISCFSRECMKADAKAFATLMSYLNHTDTKNTVVMIQVENETGMLGSDRDYSKNAEQQYQKPLPKELVFYLEKHRGELAPFLSSRTDFSVLAKSWAYAFKEDAGEIFMAYYTARYVGFVAEAGRRAYSLPMYVNAWTVQCPDEPGGMHPSGGPVSGLHDIWRCAAPEIDVFAPDLYLENFKEECAAYTRLAGNPLLIPEMRRDEWAPAEAFYAVAEHGAICVSPFGIDDLGYSPVQKAAGPVQEALQIKSTMDVSCALRQTYGILRILTPMLTKYGPQGQVRGILQDRLSYNILRFKKYFVKIVFSHALSRGRLPAGGLAIELSEDDFIFSGIGYTASFFPREKSGTAFMQIEEGSFSDGHWIPGRRLNGDELGVRFGDLPKLLRVRLYDYDL